MEIVIKPATYKHLHCAPLVSSLLNLLQQKAYKEAVTEFDYIKDQLPRLEIPDTGYNRHLLSIDNGHWLSVLNWTTGTVSPIHGHPDVAFVYVIQGEVMCVNYQENPLRQTQTHTYQAGDIFYSFGEKGQFNNAIHQICVNDFAQTLHFYSDDVDKGYVY